MKILNCENGSEYIYIQKKDILKIINKTPASYLPKFLKEITCDNKKI